MVTNVFIWGARKKERDGRRVDGNISLLALEEEINSRSNVMIVNI